MRRPMTAKQMRDVCAYLARVEARVCEADGDIEGAGKFRDLARFIERQRLTRDYV